MSRRVPPALLILFMAAAVVHAWNVFGGKARGIFDPLVSALLAE